jgi:hypothetical protein
MTEQRIQPILVMMSWRGGARLERCLASIARNKHRFKRVVISITASVDSEDMKIANAFHANYPDVEVLCTSTELPTMVHQQYWVDYLEGSHTSSGEWIYWLAYDDELNTYGIDRVVDENGSWPLEANTVYFGPWAMRHESPAQLWQGDGGDELPVWTSFPQNGPTRLPILTWIQDQLEQPTYMQMSGSLIPFQNYQELRHGKPKKTGPMRIEMATALGSNSVYVEELAEPVSIIYGRSDSDRASYGSSARKEDIHLMAWIARYAAKHPQATGKLFSITTGHLVRQLKQRILGSAPAQEEWRVRSQFD